MRGSRVLTLLQLAALVVLAGVTVARFHVWADVDERPHYDFVQRVAGLHGFPRPTDLVSPQVQAITDRTWPRPSPTNRASIGLAGRSYEAIQPPLYYVVAAPSFEVIGDYRQKVFAVRAFDALLLAVALALSWLLAQAVAPRRAAVPAFAVLLAVALWPGVVVRAITIGNTPLELALTAGFLLALWRADAGRSRRALLGAGVLLGLCLLTKLALLCLVPVFLIVLARRLRGGGERGVAALAAVLPLLLLAPWLALNHARYGALTVNITGAQGVVAPISSSGLVSRLGDLPRLNLRLLHGVLPQEWDVQLGVWWVHGVVDLLAAGLLLLALAGLRDRRGWFLALPFLGGLLLMNATYTLTGNDTFLLRYVYATLPPLALAAGFGLEQLRRPLALAVAGGASLAAAALWVDVAGAFYFTNVGRMLGI